MADDPRGFGDQPLYSQNQVTLLEVKASYERLSIQHEELKQDIKTIRYALLGNGDPATGMIIRVQGLETFQKVTIEWRKGVDRRFLFSILFQVANFLLLVLMSGIFIWAFISQLGRGLP